jgi:hypothetical protein
MSGMILADRDIETSGHRKYLQSVSRHPSLEDRYGRWKGITVTHGHGTGTVTKE